ncbi:MAG: hypothetical protein IKN89_01605 [Oscillospiraceae bacterium]|nr:hypothetical protein [Oscillospiraceae bacterium]
MDQVHEQKCAACGGPLRFDPETGKLVCDYCGTVYEIGQQEAPAAEQTLEGYDFAQLSAHAAAENAEGLPIYNCVSCGAEVIASAQEMALTCPYCGNNIVLTEKASGNLRPDGVIPFKITAKVLPQVMAAFYKDKKLLPKNFFNDSRMEKVTGVYVPFWVFSGRLSGKLQFKGEKRSSHRSGDYIITDTEHYLVGRDVSMQFRDLPVDASGRVEDELMDSLEPFGMEDVKPFDMQYLAGFTADRFDRAREDMAERARTRMNNSAEALARSQVSRDYSGVQPVGGKLRAELKARYLLFPVYLFTLTHGKKQYSFAVNGQTGKVVGSVPTDKKVSWQYFLIRAGICLGAVLLLFFVRYMLGR